MERLGSTLNPSRLVATEKRLNRCKGRIFKFFKPIGDVTVQGMLDEALTGDRNAATRLFSELRLVCLDYFHSCRNFVADSQLPGIDHWHFQLHQPS